MSTIAQVSEVSQKRVGLPDPAWVQ